MKKTDRLMNCADSQALEVFVGAHVVVSAVQRGSVSLVCVGIFLILAALSERLRLRQWACAVGFTAALFHFPRAHWILVACACFWAWYRTILDHKLQP